MPAEPLRAQLHKSVCDLAREFDAPIFDPHVTVFVGRSTVPEFTGVVESLIQTFAPMTLYADRLDHSDRYTKTFFVQFAESKILQTMSDTVRWGCTTPSDYALNPHLSLLYKNLDEANRLALCQRPAAPMGSYLFDGLRIMQADELTTEAKNVRAWRRIAEFKLGN